MSVKEKKKIRVGILFGGKSAEHEVSLQSAKNIFSAIDRSKFEPVLIGIHKTGAWLDPAASRALLPAGGFESSASNSSGRTKALAASGAESALSVMASKSRPPLNVLFPVLHGPFGEDGTVQGFLKLAGVPFVGADVLGSAVGMDKDVMKRLLRDAGIPVAKFLVFREGEKVDFKKIVQALGLPFFIKPANLGSSIGVSKVKEKKDFGHALEKAFRYDAKILIEEHIEGRELECAILGNDDPMASEVGEIIPAHEFYSYEAKYIDEKGAVLQIPARIPARIKKELRTLAVKTFKALECKGLGRVDFFLRKDGTLFVNEINTIPGFTKISMYPRLWEASGISYKELITRLIGLAIERFKKEREKGS